MNEISVSLFNTIMFLKGKLISLRALEPSDAEILYQWENNRKLWTVSYTQIPFSKFTIEEFVNAAHNDIYTNKQLRLMIHSNAENISVGIIDLFEFEIQHARSGLGIYINETSQRSGFASEALELIKLYCFETLLLKQIYVHVGENNAASLALFEKAGFQKTALKKCWNKIGLNTFENVWFMQFINTRD